MTIRPSCVLVPLVPALASRTRGISGATLEEAVRSFGHWKPEMLVGPGGEHATARSALQQALLKQVGLEHVLDRVGLLADRHGQGREADRPAGELGRDDIEQGAVAGIEPAGAD